MSGRKSEEEETLHGSKRCVRIGNVLGLSDTLSLSLVFYLCCRVDLPYSITAPPYLRACLGLIFALCERIRVKTRPKQESENMPSICSCTRLDGWLVEGSVLFLLLLCVFGREWMAVNFTTVHVCMDDYLGCV